MKAALDQSSVTHAPHDAGPQRVSINLTPTELKVLRGVHRGRLNKQIAWELGIAEKTVKTHMTALIRKFNVQNRTQVAIAAHAMAGDMAYFLAPSDL